MERACSWDEPPSNIPREAWERLSTLYDSPSDIDLFTAGLLEDQGANSTDILVPILKVFLIWQYK